MASIGLKCLQSDSGIFVYKDKGDLVIAVVYVDDALFLGSNLPLVNRLKSLFMNKWECRDLGETKEFLCMRIIHKQGMIFLDQTAYLQKVLQCFQMTNVRAAITPLPAGYNPVPNPDPYDTDTCHKFQQVIGSLLYIMLGTCPDIAYAVTKLLQYAANPSKDHLAKVSRFFLLTVRYDWTRPRLLILTIYRLRDTMMKHDIAAQDDS
jgi:Reverse transcriptase (RNA-dependent DNA polymerase)